MPFILENPPVLIRQRKRGQNSIMAMQQSHSVKACWHLLLLKVAQAVYECRECVIFHLALFFILKSEVVALKICCLYTGYLYIILKFTSWSKTSVFVFGPLFSRGPLTASLLAYVLGRLCRQQRITSIIHSPITIGFYRNLCGALLEWVELDIVGSETG